MPSRVAHRTFSFTLRPTAHGVAPRTVIQENPSLDVLSDQKRMVIVGSKIESFAMGIRCLLENKFQSRLPSRQIPLSIPLMHFPQNKAQTRCQEVDAARADDRLQLNGDQAKCSIRLLKPDRF